MDLFTLILRRKWPCGFCFNAKHMYFLMKYFVRIFIKNKGNRAEVLWCLTCYYWRRSHFVDRLCTRLVCGVVNALPHDVLLLIIRNGRILSPINISAVYPPTLSDYYYRHAIEQLVWKRTDTIQCLSIGTMRVRF